MDDKALEAINALLNTLFAQLGPFGTMGLLLLIALLFFGWRVYSDYRKDSEINKALAAKDETIQMMAEHHRELRVIHLKLQGWSDDAIERFILKSTPKNPIEARKMLEEGNDLSDNELDND